MSEDARSRTKHYLEEYLLNANLTKDDNSTQVKFIVMFANPDYPLILEFQTNNIDLIFTIDNPISTPLLESNLNVWAYEEHVPVEAFCINKPGISGVLLKWKADHELRRIGETHPWGSIRTFTDRSDSDYKLGSTTIYGVKWILNYRRRKK